MSNADYRSMLTRVAGCHSSTKVPAGKREAVLGELRRLGASNIGRARTRRTGLRLEGFYAGKMQALWIAGYNLGIIRDNSDAALMAFIKRQTGLDHTRWLNDNRDATKAINALKRWLERDGGVDWQQSQYRAPHTQGPQYRIAHAQCRYLFNIWLSEWAKTEHLAAIKADDGIRLAAAEAGIAVTKPVAAYDRHEWIAIMNLMGPKIRAHKAKAAS
ncbi:MAG: regulatory protein GemA [Roseitalea sp.]|nr:regulatory protein GemA [Roseitalea sp.]MBO6951004.1 regulatory protein GemA [Rhizobiaceae bacterium]MBO6591009.1 regulatory protein GemA [Roseitalea sp.]MBO6599733.1 regulatory protein GemA [Roseitalea sp.]MBO6611489.1 regulatory protein GemA [Roseitalea sp.]